MSIWEKEDWIKDILSKSGTEIQEVTTHNEIRKMVYYTALPLIMQTDNGGGGGGGGPTQLCLSPNNIDSHHPHHQALPNNNQIHLNNNHQHQQHQQPQHIINLSNNNSTTSTITLQLDQQLQQQQQQQQQHHHIPQSNTYSVQIIPNNKGMLLGGSQQQQSQQQQQQLTSPILLQNNKFKCEQCNMCFGSKSAHTSHMKSHIKQYQAPHHAATTPSPPTTIGSSDPYQCDVCKKTFAVPARLVRHYRTHTGERPFECEFCHKMFSVKENLQVHRRIHTKERPYKCDVCGRAFEHSGKLHRHMRIHTGERPHKCSVCAKTFIQSGQLVIHMRTHTGEKPYKCPVEGCGKGFTCSKQLKVHSRTHTGEKPYHCDICFRDFGYNHVLKLHRVQHYGSKCYKCTICDETFKSKKEMEAHIKGHANEMPEDDDMGDDEENTDELERNDIHMINPNNIKLENINQRQEEPLQKEQHELNVLLQTDTRKISPPLLELSLSPPQLNDGLNDLTCYNMYTRFEQSVVNSYGIHSGVNPALLAAASIAASATPAMVATSNNNGCSSLSSPSSNMSLQNGNDDLSRSHSPITNNFVYEPLAIMRQHGFFVPAPQAPEFKPSVLASDTLRRVEAALAGTETLLTPPRSSPESPDRDSSSPDSDSILMVNRDNNTLPPRKRKLYFKDNQQNPNDVNSMLRVSSVIQYAKAS